MLLVVDANVVFSALLKAGKTLDIFLLNRGYKRFEFLAPEFLMVEIKNHEDEIVNRTGLSIEKLGKVLNLDALVTRRNSIAHGNLDSTATSGDVKRYVKSIFELVGRLDGMTYRHLHNVTSVDPDALKSLIESYYSRIDSEFA